MSTPESCCPSSAPRITGPRPGESATGTLQAKPLPRIIGILNVTPDSFSDGGLHLDPDAAIAQAHQMHADGADWIDIGGESTRPGSRPVDADEQLRRILPVVEPLAAAGLPLSIDTSDSRVARRCLEAGARMINDVSAGADSPDMLQVALEYQADLVLMHRRGTPANMQQHTDYEDILSEVYGGLLRRAQTFTALGGNPDQIWLDPGIGFGKDLQGNLQLIRAIDQARHFGYRSYLGMSRKRFLGDITGEQDPGNRLGASLGAALCAWHIGVDALRVHDPGALRQAILSWNAIAATPPLTP